MSTKETKCLPNIFYHKYINNKCVFCGDISNLCYSCNLKPKGKNQYCNDCFYRLVRGKKKEKYIDVMSFYNPKLR
jgi:hypothetical protein